MRHHAVPGEGPSDAKLCFIGEGPGAAEDLAGRPFCGRAGTFFDSMLAVAGLERKDVYVTSAVKCRPPENRTPHQNEYRICGRFWLRQQLEILKPTLIVLMGKTAVLQSLEETASLATLHGTVREKNGYRYYLTYHPAAGMRFPAAANAMRDDFQGIQTLLRMDQ